MPPYPVTFSVEGFSRRLIEVSSILRPELRRVLGAADGSADGGAPGWGAGVALRSQCRCPATLMGADASKNRKVSRVFKRCDSQTRASPSPWDVLTWITRLQSCKVLSNGPKLFILTPLDPITINICLLNYQWTWHVTSHALVLNAEMLWQSWHTLVSK